MPNMAVMTTACSRPAYLQQTLTSWANVDGVTSGLSAFAVALGQSPKEFEQINLIRSIAPGAHIWLDSPAAARSNGMHRAIAEAATRAFTELKADFLVLSEEDLTVSSDILRYMAWAEQKFRADKRVLAVCAHSPGGNGWDDGPCDDEGADQEQVRLLPYFAAWTWGTWKDRWFAHLLPQWDFECDSGGMLDSGWDWNVATRILPKGDFLCVVPDASRSQNIGVHGGWSATPETFPRTQSAAYRERRDSPAYRLVEAE